PCAATPVSTLLPAPTLGLGMIDQRLPSKCSISVLDFETPSIALLIESPTAQTSLPATAATPVSSLLTLLLGVGDVVQLVPLKCVASVAPFALPTDQMSDGPTALMPLSTLAVVDGPFTSDQPADVRCSISV